MRHASGFSLLEVLVATTLVTVGVAALAQMFVLGMHANHMAGTTTIATLLANTLRAAQWQAGY